MLPFVRLQRRFPIANVGDQPLQSQKGDVSACVRRDLFKLILQHFPNAAYAECNALLMDDLDLSNATVLLCDDTTRPAITSYYVPSPQAESIAKHVVVKHEALPHRIKLFGATTEQLVTEAAGDVLWDVISYNVGLVATKEHMMFLCDMLKRHPFNPMRPVLLDVAFEAKGPLFALTLRMKMETWLLEAGCHYSIFALESMLTGHESASGVQTIFFMLVPKEVMIHEHAKLTLLYQSVEKTITNLYAAAVQPKAAGFDIDVGSDDDDDDDDDEAVPHKKRKSPAKPEVKEHDLRRKPGRQKVERLNTEPSPFKQHQHVEVNCHNWPAYPHSNNSRMPCRIATIKANGIEATVKPIIDPEDVPCEVKHPGKKSGKTTPNMVVPLTRIELRPPEQDVPMKISDFAINMPIETAWRAYLDEPIAWWSAIVLTVGRSMIEVRSGPTGEEKTWVEPAWCRPMKTVKK